MIGSHGLLHFEFLVHVDKNILCHKRTIIYRLFVLSMFVQSCAIPLPGSKDTRHLLIIGLGITTQKAANEEAAMVTTSKSLGLTMSNMPGVKASLGYSSAKIVTLSQDADLLIQVKHSLTDDIEICTNELELCDQITKSNQSQ